LVLFFKFNPNTFRASSAKEKLLDESLKNLTRERILQLIEEGFKTAKAPVILLTFFSFSVKQILLIFIA